MIRAMFAGNTASANLLALDEKSIVAQAQQARRVPQVGYIDGESRSAGIEGLLTGLRELGYVEGQNIVIEYRWAEGRYDRFPGFIAEAASLKVDVIVTEGAPAAIAARQGTKTIPIVMVAIGDPITSGVVLSVARPGGNITGLTSMTAELNTKRLELLKELVPGASRIAVLWNPANPNHKVWIPKMQAAAKSLRLTLEPLVGAGDSEQIDKGFGAIVAARSQALIMVGDLALLAQRERIVDFATKRKLPGLYAYRKFVEIGGADRAMLEAVEAGDAEGFFDSVARDGDARRICGLSPIYALLRGLGGTRGALKRYAQWPDPQGVVTFASVVFDDRAG